MIHTEISSPLRSPSRRKRHSSSGRRSTGSAKRISQDEEILPSVPKVLLTGRHSSFYKQGKSQIEISNLIKKKKSYPIAPDAFLPNSSYRTVLKRKEIKPVEIKVFQLRLDILKNLQMNDIRNPNWQDDDADFVELTDSDTISKSISAKNSKETLVSRQKAHNDRTLEDVHNKYWNKDTIPDLFKRMQNESWWKQVPDEKPNLLSMLLYLKTIIKKKKSNSYESACYYVIEIFRTYGIEPLFVNQILDILLNHLSADESNPLDICTIRTIAQFMIERKDLIVQLLEYALNFPPSDMLRQEVVNAVKFIADVKNSDEIDLVLDHITVVYDYPEDNFSLKMIIKIVETMPKIAPAAVLNEEEEEENIDIHPLLKKISKERWFPQGNISITLDYVLDAIVMKLSDTTKTLIKTLTTHLVQIHHVIGYSKEQCDRVSDAFITLLSNDEADYRLIAATNLAKLNKETKSIDIALLNSFINDSRILVRTECCDTLKILTGIMSDIVLTDCADDILYLQSVPEENFSLQNYLKEKNRVLTPEQSSLEITEDLNMNEIETHENSASIIYSRSPSLQNIDGPSIVHSFPPLIRSETNEFRVTPSLSSSTTPVQPTNHVEIDDKRNSISSHLSKLRETAPSVSSLKSPIAIRITKKRSSHISTTRDSWDSCISPHDLTEPKENIESQLNFDSSSQTALLINDTIQTIIEEHKQTVGFYRMIPNRPILIPHKITLDNIFGDRSHIIIHEHLSQSHHIHSHSFQSPMTSMSLIDFNHNQQYLHEIESTQLLSSLVIRAIQIHRQHDKFIPGSFSGNFENLLSISQMQLKTSVNVSSRLPPVVPPRPTSRQYAHIQSNIQAKAFREGINVSKAQTMGGALSNLLQTNQTTMTSSLTSYLANSKLADITHAWLLVHLLKSRGIFYSESYLQRIIQFYPKFLPLLHAKIPHYLISIIWNDPMIKHIASIFSNKQNQLVYENSSIKRNHTKSSVPITEDEYSLNSFEYLSLIHRDDHKKKFLPSIHSSKINFPRQVLKTSSGDIDMNSVVSSNNSLPKLHKGRVYMHLMMPSNENTLDQQESIKSRSQQTIKTDYRTTPFLPIITRVPVCH